MSRSKNTKADMKFQRVMHEFGKKKLTSHGTIVTDQKQALAIAFEEARKVNPSYAMKEGGAAPDSLEKIYATGTSEQLWENGWDEKKRSHFLIDHADMYMEEMGKNFNLSVEKFAKIKYSELPNTIKKQVVIHHAMGIYKEGGIIKPGMKLSPENKKIKLRIDTLKSSFSGIKSEKAKKKIQDKIDKLQKQFEYRPSTKEKIESNKGKFAMDVPTEYSKSIYKKLWTMHVFPKVHKLNGTSSIVVNSRNNLAKAYKVYSDIIKEKKEDAPTLSKISRKL